MCAAALFFLHTTVEPFKCSSDGQSMRAGAGGTLTPQAHNALNTHKPVADPWATGLPMSDWLLRRQNMQALTVKTLSTQPKRTPTDGLQPACCK
jgi:hypothetical protein